MGVSLCTRTSKSDDLNLMEYTARCSIFSALTASFRLQFSGGRMEKLIMSFR